jgi:ribosome-binding factor A
MMKRNKYSKILYFYTFNHSNFYTDMESQRQLKVGKMLQKELSDMFQKELKPILEGAFITISEVKMSPDLGIATVYLSLTLVKNHQALLDRIDENLKSIRQKLGQRIRHQVRIIPELRFFKDEALEYAEKIDKLLKELNIPKETPE